jgi:hypothetical protein
VRDLFVGAIGIFKNPSSHRNVQFDDPGEAADMISTANQLLRMCGQGCGTQHIAVHALMIKNLGLGVAFCHQA